MKKTNKGFTLVELIIVIAILAIIMLIAIPNFSGIQQRMQVRADKATAAQIGKAVRVWFTDYTTDKTLKNSGDNYPDGLGVPSDDYAVSELDEYSTLVGIENYIAKNQRAKSLRDKDNNAVAGGGYYAVFLTADETDPAAKIAVAIVPDNANGTAAVGKIKGITEVAGTPVTYKVSADYDGLATSDGTITGGVAYIEP